MFIEVNEANIHSFQAKPARLMPYSLDYIIYVYISRSICVYYAFLTRMSQRTKPTPVLAKIILRQSAGKWCDIFWYLTMKAVEI
jgi:hypothetical protein